MADDDGLDELMPDWGRDAKAAPPPPRPSPPEPPPDPRPLRVPPHSLEAEYSVLGSLLLDGSRWNDVAAIVGVRDFYKSENKIVFEAMAGLAAASQPIDAVTVADALGESSKLDRVGGAAFLAEVVETTPGTRNVEAYAEVVFEKARRRRVIAQSQLVIESAFDSNADFEESLNELKAVEIFRKGSITMHTGSDLKSMGAPIPWIWRGWLPAGMLTLLAGEKGKGKSTLAMSVAACLTTGKVPWDDRGVGEPMRVVYWTGEDDIRIVVGRALAAGVDFDYFEVVGEVGDRPFEPSTDMPKLLDQFKDEPPDVFIIDPLIRLLKGKNSSAEDVRRSLDPVAAEAEKMGIAILGIGHFSKASGDRQILDRFLGSQAWAARARMCWALVGAAGKTLFGKAATNLASPNGVMELTFEEVVVTFDSGATDLYTRTVYSEVNADQTLDELERALAAEQAAAELEERRSTKYEADIAAATEWFWEGGRKGFCTSDEWKEYCAGQNWSLKSSTTKGRKMQSMMGLKMTRRGVPGRQVTYWYLPSVDPTESII